MKLLWRPYHLFLLAAILLLIGYRLHFPGTLDIHVHDTYYVIDQPDLCLYLSAFHLFTWLLYVATQRLLYSWKLIRVHAVISILLCLLLIYTPYFFTWSAADGAGAPRRYIDTGVPESLRIQANLSAFIIWDLIILSTAYTIYLFNLTMGLVSRRKKAMPQ